MTPDEHRHAFGSIWNLSIGHGHHDATTIAVASLSAALGDVLADILEELQAIRAEISKPNQ